MQKCVVFLRQKPYSLHFAALMDVSVNTEGRTGLRNISANRDMPGQSQVPAFECFVSKHFFFSQKANEIKTQS